MSTNGMTTHRVTLAPRSLYKRYAATISGLALAMFAATLIIPYCYDQANLTLFLKAEADGTLFVQEYASDILSAYLDHLSINDIQSRDVASLANEFLRAKRPISLDYVHQMRAAREPVEHKLLAFVILLGVVLTAAVYCLARFVNHKMRAPLLASIFVVALLSIQFFGLPHTNRKFHIVLGMIYALILALTDVLHTLNIRFPRKTPSTEDDTWPGRTLSLQYRHQFWTMVFNISVVALLTFVCTTSFVTYTTLRSVFGDGFVINPLVGLLIAIGLALVGAIFGILRPIRSHLATIEDALFPTIE